MKYLKVFLTFSIVLFAGFPVLIGLLLMLLSQFIGTDWIIISAFLIFVVTLALFLIGLLWRRRAWKLYTAFLLISMLVLPLTYGGIQFSKQLSESKKMPEVEVDLSLYDPFKEPSKLAELDEPCMLRLIDDLPIIDGSTALYPVYSAFARAVYPKRDYIRHDGNYSYFVVNELRAQLKDNPVACAGTARAVFGITEKITDIAFVPMPSMEQQRSAEEIDADWNFIPIGRDAFVFFVNEKNKVNNLTTQQLQDIYAGKITNWKEVGGSNEEILAYQRAEFSGSQNAFLNFMKGVDLATPPQDRFVGGMGGIIHKTADFKNSKSALGYSFRYYATEMNKNNKIKLLSIDGIYPSVETIKSGEYPFGGDFYAMTRGEPTGNSKLLIEWILSPQGQELIKKTGYVPVK